MKQKLLLKTMLLLLCMIVGVSSSWADSGTLVSALNGIEDGETYYIAAFNSSKYYTVPNTTIAGQTFTCTEGSLSESTLAVASGAGEFVFTAVSGVSNAYYIYNTNLKKYLVAIASKKFGYVDSKSSDYGYWTFSTVSSGGFSGLFSVQHSSKTQYMRAYSNSVRCYDGASNNGIYLFKKQIPAHTLTYSASNGSISGVVYNTSTAVSSGASIEEGGKVTLTATPASGYTFTGWSVSENGGTFSDASANPTTFTMGTANATVTANFVSASLCATPSFTVDEGTYNEAKSVEINCGTDGATIYYTTDGTDPTTSSSVYSSAIAVNASTTIKAFAVKDGMTNSGIASATYTLKCATPEITVPAGVFLDTKEVTMTSSDGASIYYTIDGSEPTSSSTAYDPSNKPSISATTTLKAIATKSGWSDSEVATETFTKIVPKTVGEALIAIAALANNGSIDNQYVSGVVCTAGTLSSGTITYYISDDGTETNRLQVYKGKGLNNADFKAASDIAVGDAVVVFGQLKKYVSGNNTTPEFNSGNYLISKVTKETPTFSLDPTSKTLDAYTHETVDITLTTNTDGAITCESDDEDVATVALKSGNVYTITAKTEGTATITISSAASATYKPASATVSITVTDARAAAGISFTKDAEEITWGDSYTTQTLTNTNSVAVVWSSTDKDVATVNENTGEITILKAGTTDIKATFAGNATYKAAVASYTLTVNKAAADLSYTTTSFDIMLNDDTFEAPTLNNPNGLTVTYASSDTDVATVNATTGELSYVSSAVGTAKITATFVANDWYKGGSANYTINIIDPTVKGTKYNPYTVAEVNSGNYSGINYVKGYIVGFFNGKDSNASSSGNSNLALSDTPDEISGANTIAVQLPSGAIRAAWNIDDNNVIGMEVLIKGNITGYFTNKTGVKSPSEITAVSIPAKLNASGYATFASTYALDFSDDTEFSAWQITDITTSAITFSQIKGAVAAGTGVLLKGTASSTINIPVAASGTDISTTNKLVGITTATAIIADQYYGLSGNKFVKVNAGTVKAGKALLPASKIPTTARELKFVFEDETTAIRGIENGQLRMENSFFDLQGRKIAKPTKGLYIKNGKKVVFK